MENHIIEGVFTQSGSFSEVATRIGEVCFAPINGLRQSGLSGPKSANFGNTGRDVAV
jgi:hypothetical protein